MTTKLGSILALLGASVLAGACSDDMHEPADAGPSDAGVDQGGTAFTPPADPGKGGFWVTVSGEDLAVVGYDWTSTSLSGGDPPAFVDGWALSFEHVIVTLDKIRVNADPDKDPGDPQLVGPLVASADGPWAVDATIGGNVVGKSGSPDEKTIPIVAFASQANGDPFDTTARYAFGYDIAAASPSAKIVNLDAAGLALYEEAKQKGWSMIFAGTAKYQGPAPDPSSVFAKIPTEVKFTLGLKNPSSYVNCRNTDFQIVGDDFPRGVQSSAARGAIAQITVHTDHAFWDRLNVEGAALHFDAIAANASTYGTPEKPGIVTIEDLIDVDVSGFKTKGGEQLPWRSAVSDYTAPAGQMRFDPNGTSFTKANSYAAYLAYSASAGGHLNADGECAIKNHFAP